MKSATRWENRKGRREEKKSTNRWAVLELWKRAYELDHKKLYFENQDKHGRSMASQWRGRQHQGQLNSDTTQENVATNISRNIRKKMIFFFRWCWGAQYTRKINDIRRSWRPKVKILGMNRITNNVQKYEKVKYNFDTETVNHKINKWLNANLLKFNMIYMRSSH